MLRKLFFSDVKEGKKLKKREESQWMVAANGFVGSMVVLLHLSSADVFYKKVSKDILDKTDQRGAKIACRKLLVKTHWL